MSKVKVYSDLVVLGLWVWSNLCGVTASLKFRQFNSAVCDAFGMYLAYMYLLYAYAHGYADCLSRLGCGLIDLTWFELYAEFGACGPFCCGELRVTVTPTAREFVSKVVGFLGL